MAAFIHTIKGKIVFLDAKKKEISLLVKENPIDVDGAKKLYFNLDPNVRIVNSSQQPIYLGALKINQNVEVGYLSNKSKMLASSIKIIS